MPSFAQMTNARRLIIQSVRRSLTVKAMKRILQHVNSEFLQKLRRLSRKRVRLNTLTVGLSLVLRLAARLWGLPSGSWTSRLLARPANIISIALKRNSQFYATSLKFCANRALTFLKLMKKLKMFAKLKKTSGKFPNSMQRMNVARVRALPVWSPVQLSERLSARWCRLLATCLAVCSAVSSGRNSANTQRIIPHPLNIRTAV